MLDPDNSLGKPGHAAAEELLKGVIELCSAAPSASSSGGGAGNGGGLSPHSGGNGGSPLSAGPNGSGGSGASGGDVDDEWRDNSLARQLAEAKTIKTMVEWMLAGLENAPLDPKSPPSVAPTPEEEQKVSELRTSSLVQSISVVVDLIRKNNSDFVEQQMLAWARRREKEEMERELLEEEGSIVVDTADGGGDGEGGKKRTEKGPSLVDLGGLLETIATNLAGFQELIKAPRSLEGPIVTTAGSITPLTVERFRICELYAELLHCSNMSLLNRPPPHVLAMYNREGHLAKGWRAVDELSDAVAGHFGVDEEEEQEENGNGEAVEVDNEDEVEGGKERAGVLDVVSALSTPSALSSADDDGSDPFGDPVDEAEEETEEIEASTEDYKDRSVEAITEAAEGIHLDEELMERLRKKGLTTTASRSQSGVDKDEKTPKSKTARPRPLEAEPPKRLIPPGQLLKRKFMEHHIVDNMLDLFFNYPWNNFLHNVVFDILQQIFSGRLDRPLDRQLALSVFLDARLIDRILEGQAANDANPRGTRLGYMGHMTLIAEEVIKLFDHYPHEIYAVVEPQIPQPQWDRYVATTLRETRERDLSRLGGGIHQISHTPSIRSGISDEDDEFPMHSAKVLRAMEASQGGVEPVSPKTRSESPTESASPTDQFSRYLENAMASNRGDKFASSDEDDDDEDEDSGWMGGSRPSQFPSGDIDFAVAASAKPPPSKFSFDDAFASASAAPFDSAGGEDDDEWGTFGSAPEASTSTSSALGFESSFSDTPFDNFAPVTSGFDDDDGFGDFETADSPSIVLPAMDALDDFDFNEDSRPPSSPNSAAAVPLAPLRSPTRPVFARTITADDGSSLFGGLSSSLDDVGSPTAPRERRLSRSSGNSMSPPTSPTSPSIQADLATSLDEPLGPSMHDGSHLTDDGFVEAEVDGKKVRVPADEIALAHRRSSIDSATERPKFGSPNEV